MPKATGDREWLVEDLPPNADNPLPGVIVRGHADGAPVLDGPAWRFDPEGEADARAAAAHLAERRNAAELAARQVSDAGKAPAQSGG